MNWIYRSQVKSEAETKKCQSGLALLKLNAKELERLYNIVKYDPVKTTMAKQALGV